MLSYYNKDPSFEVFERDDGFLNAVVGADEYFSKYKEWGRHEREAIRYARGTCLDVGCGAGRVTLYLQSKGLDVTGIDTSPLAIKVCKLRGVKKARVMQIEEVMRFGRKRFDTIVLFGIGFNLLQNAGKARRILNVLYRITTAGGVIIAESRDPYITTNPVHFAYHRRNLKAGRLPGQLREKIRFMQYSSGWVDILFASKKEVRAILKGTGWTVKRFIDSKDYKKGGRFMIIIQKER